MKQPKIVDKNYRTSFRGKQCEACGIQDDTIVGAHVRAGEYAGMGTKPSDDLIVALCFHCHAEQESEPGAMWWLNNILKPILRERYVRWKNNN